MTIIDKIDDLIAQVNLIDNTKYLTIEEHNDLRTIRFALIKLRDRMVQYNDRVTTHK